MEYDSGASLYGGHSTPAGYKGGYYTACAQVRETHQQSKSRRSRSPLYWFQSRLKTTSCGLEPLRKLAAARMVDVVHLQLDGVVAGTS